MACAKYENTPTTCNHNYEDGICTICQEVKPSDGLLFELNYDKKSYSIVGIGTCTDTDLIIPSIYNNLPVTTIGSYAFEDCDSLTSITIPSSVTIIDTWAFEDCDSLTSVIFEENSKLTTIGSYAFCYCYSLTDITIPSSVTSIGYAAFVDCESLTSITIPSSVACILSSTFDGCYRLTNITIPRSVTSIGESAFYSCDSLNTVYYTSTKSEWNTISIGTYNSELTDATRYYYSETAPTTKGNYWHYVDGEIVVW